MAYLEKNFTTDFNKWLKYRAKFTGAFELKCTNKQSIPFSAVEEHQEDALYAAKHGTVVYKIPDTNITPNPFDTFVLANAPAFVVIMFGAKSDHFYLIDIDVWQEEKKKSSRKSLTEERAMQIGFYCEFRLPLPDECISHIRLLFSSNLLGIFAQHDHA